MKLFTSNSKKKRIVFLNSSLVNEIFPLFYGWHANCAHEREEEKCTIFEFHLEIAEYEQRISI